jgi:hypothetical protein
MTAAEVVREAQIVKRALLRSPAFGRDMRHWLKAHPESAASLQATLDQFIRRSIPIRAPLPGIAMYVIEPERIGLELTDWRGEHVALLSRQTADGGRASPSDAIVGILPWWGRRITIFTQIAE